MKVINIMWRVNSDEELEMLPEEVELPDWVKDHSDIDQYLYDTEECRFGGYTLAE